MRTVLATIIRRFDMEYAPNFKAQDWAGQQKDQFALMCGPLLVVLLLRKY
jgi:hypothetical protein